MVVGMLFCPWPGYRTAPDCLSLPRNVHLPSSQTTLREYQVEERAARVYRPSGRKSSVVTKTFLSSTKKKKNDFSQMAANAHCERQRSGRSRRKKKKEKPTATRRARERCPSCQKFLFKKKKTTQIATKENGWCVSFIPRLRLTKQPSRAWIYIISKRERKRRNPPDTRSISPAGLYQHDDQPFLFFPSGRHKPNKL